MLVETYTRSDYSSTIFPMELESRNVGFLRRKENLSSGRNFSEQGRVTRVTSFPGFVNPGHIERSHTPTPKIM